jgi:hypothetical protein
MLKGRGHTNALRFYARVEKMFGNLGYVSTAIGQWQGLEATTITDDPFSNLETLRAKAVLKALYSAQLGTALFIPDHPPNNGSMYQLTFSRATPQAVSHRLSEAGLEAWTMILRRGEIEIRLLNQSQPGSEEASKYTNFISSPFVVTYAKKIEATEGKIIFDGALNRKEAAAHYRSILASYEETIRKTEERHFHGRLHHWFSRKGGPGTKEFLKLVAEAETNFARLIASENSKLVDKQRPRRQVPLPRTRAYFRRSGRIILWRGRR